MKDLVRCATLASLLLAAPAGAVGTSTTTTTTSTTRPSTMTTTTLPSAKCPGTARGEVVNRDGCSVAQLCPCDAPRSASAWKSHGAYVSCVRQALNAFRKAKLLDPKTAAAALANAKKSQCGAPPRSFPTKVRCCSPQPSISAKPFCLQLTTSACAHRHGQNIGRGSCVPNPCR